MNCCFYDKKRKEKLFNQINSIPLTIQWLSIYILLKDNVWRLSSNDFANHTIISFWYSIQIHFKRKKNLVIFIDQKSITLCVYNCKKDRRMSSLSFSSIERYSIFVPINMVIVFNDLFLLKNKRLTWLNWNRLSKMIRYSIQKKNDEKYFFSAKLNSIIEWRINGSRWSSGWQKNSLPNFARKK